MLGKTPICVVSYCPFYTTILVTHYWMVLHLPIAFCKSNSMVPNAIWKKKTRHNLSKLHEPEGRVRFVVFEKLTSAYFKNLHENPNY